MSTPQSFLLATINRLGARLGSQLADRAAEFAVFAQDAPERLRQELGLFWEEVEREAQRLDNGDVAGADAGVPGVERASGDPQEQIDALRAQVANLARKLEQPIPGGGQAGSF